MISQLTDTYIFSFIKQLFTLFRPLGFSIKFNIVEQVWFNICIQWQLFIIPKVDVIVFSIDWPWLGSRCSSKYLFAASRNVDNSVYLPCPTRAGTADAE